MKKLKIISIIFGVLVLLMIMVGIIFSTVYEDKVKNFIIQKINNSINTKIDAKEVSFSVFKKFPYASLKFTEVTALEMSKKPKKEELFNAQSIYLQFNILDILREDYIIKKVQVENGNVSIKIDRFGNDNYHFWKTSSDTNQLSVALEYLTFEDVNFYLLNEYKDVDLDININKLLLSGNFSSKDYTLSTQARLHINQINENGRNIAKNKTVFVQTDIDVNTVSKMYKIKSGKLALQDLNFIISGKIKDIDRGVELYLKTTGNEMKINKLFSLFPLHLQEKLSTYKTSGIITYTSTIDGHYSSKESPNFNAEFSITNGKITENKSNQSLTNINLIGSFTNGNQQNNASSKLILKELEADFGAGHIFGNYTLTDFNNPYIVFNTNANLDLATARHFFKWDTLSTATGLLEMNLSYSGYIKELDNLKAHELHKLNAKGNVRLMDGVLQLKNSDNKFENINGTFRFNNNEVKIDTLNFILNHNKFEIDGKLKNLLAYLFIEDEPIAINTNFYASKLVLEDFLKTEKNENGYQLKLPANVYLRFKAKIDSLEFRKFSAEQINGYIELEDKILTATNLSFSSMQGKIEGDIAIDDSEDDKILITSKGKLTQINIHQLFVQFENFGQNHIQAKNIKGITTTTIEFASVWDKQLQVDKDKIYVLADINVTQGELIDYKPVLAMSKFVGIEELEHIKFNRLSTQIEIKNKVIHLPKTEINSSAIDVTIAGTHTFDNHIDYRFKLLLNDVLWHKAKKKKKEITEFGYVADDGLGKTAVFLKMTGTIDDYKISYDTKGLKENWNESLKEEKHTLKKILHDEFGWYKKDSSLKKEEKPKDDGLIIEWEEAEEKTTNQKNQDEQKDTKKKKEKKGIGKFLDKIAKPDEEEYEEFDDL